MQLLSTYISFRLLLVNIWLVRIKGYVKHRIAETTQPRYTFTELHDPAAQLKIDMLQVPKNFYGKRLCYRKNILALHTTE